MYELGTWLLDPPIRLHAGSSWGPIKCQDPGQLRTNQMPGAWHMTMQPEERTDLRANQKPGIRAWLQWFPGLYKPIPNPQILQLLLYQSHVIMFEIYKPDIWLTSNSNLVIILAIRALRLFSRRLERLDSADEIAVSLPVGKDRRSLVIMIITGDIGKGFPNR